mmetsp:Transcript_33864/g.79175  ORF Transcript_33864/g.79175 Transcript_33864/m.79175 type:complete len:464 (+) Transcript_33864:116-1507(+)
MAVQARDSLSTRDKICVKNTFIDLVDDGLQFPPEASRARSAPPADSITFSSAYTESDEEQDGAAEGEEQADDGDEDAPAMQPIHRVVTCDGMEDRGYWDAWDEDEAPSRGGSQEVGSFAPGPPTHTIGDGDLPQIMMTPPVEASSSSTAPPLPPVQSNNQQPQQIRAQPPTGSLPAGGVVLMQTVAPRIVSVVGCGSLERCPPGCVPVPVSVGSVYQPFARWPQSDSNAHPPSPHSPYVMQNPSPVGSVTETQVTSPSSQQAPPPPPVVAPPDMVRPPSTETPAPALPPSVEEAPVTPARGVMPALQPLKRVRSEATGIHRVHVTVPARILGTKDRSYVSPQFELPLNGKDCPFRLTLWPKQTGQGRGGASFAKAKGKGRVELKSEGDVETGPAYLHFKVSIGSVGGKQEPPRGPVKHNFAEQPCAGLKEGQEIWNFNEVVDSTTGTFVICLEVIPEIVTTGT